MKFRGCAKIRSAKIKGAKIKGARKFKGIRYQIMHFQDSVEVGFFDLYAPIFGIM